MRVFERERKLDKERLFTQLQAGEMCSFTKTQLMRLEDLGIVVPMRKYRTLLYTWEQVIFLRFMYLWRKKLTLAKVIKVLKNYNVELFIQNIKSGNLIAFNNEQVKFFNGKYDFEEIEKIKKSFEVDNDTSEIAYDFPKVTIIDSTEIIKYLLNIGYSNIKDFELKIGDDAFNIRLNAESVEISTRETSFELSA
jgi:hypothetical protein